MTGLDIRTLSFAAMLSALLLAVGLQLVNRIIARDPSLQLWAEGATVTGAAYVLIALRGVAPDLLSIVAANTLLVAGAAVVYQGNRKFRGLEREFPWYWLVTAAAGVAIFLFTYLWPNLPTRIVALSTAIAAILLPCGIVLLYPGDERDRVVRWFVAAGFLAAALFNFARGVMTPFMDLSGKDFMTVASPLQTLAVVVGIALNVILAVGLPLLVAGRLQRRVTESEAEYRLLTENSKDVVWILDAESMRFRYVSPSVLRQLGYTRDEVVNAPMAPTLVTAKGEPLYDLVRGRMNALVDGASPPDVFYTDEIEQPCRDGSTVWTEVVSGYYRNPESSRVEVRGVTRDISERKRVERELRASEQKFAKAFRSSPEFITISTLDDGRYIDVNEAFERTTGFSRDEAIGRSTIALGLWVDPAERRQLVELMRQHGRVRNFALRLRDKSGAVMQCELSAETLDLDGVTCMLAVTQDVTQRFASLEALRESEERFRDLITLSSDWFWEQDGQLRFTVMSEGITRKTGFSAARALGKTRWELPIEGLTEAQWAEHRAQLERRQPFENFTFQLRNDDGELRWSSTSGKPLFAADGAFRGYRGVSHDVTEQVLREQQLRQTQKMEAIGQLAGGIAHDFNNILASIRGGVQLVRAELPAGHGAASCLDQIERSTTRAVDLVRQILTFSQGQDKVRAPLDPAAAVQAAVQLLRAALPPAIVIRTELQPNLPFVRTNLVAVHQLIMNLGTNAAQAMAGAGRLDIGVCEADVDAMRAAQVPGLKPGRFVCLTARDSGAGMDAATLARIFEPFYSTKYGAEGTGLGLSVVYGIVREHGGAITVQSTPGQGTEFRIFLPAVEAPAMPATASPATVAGGRGHGERLLFVDDEEDLVVLSLELLRQMGYRVDGFLSGELALAAFVKEPGGFDAMITDLSMPGISGIDLAQKVREIRPGFPIIVMSGHIRDADAQRAAELGLGEIHWKPNTVQDLAETLRRRLLGTP